MPEKIIVIGSNSFSGASFASFGLEKGFEVVGISRSVEPNPVFLPYKYSGGNIEFHQLDLNHDLDKVMSIINFKKPEYVVNFAAQSMVAQSWDHPDHWFLTNVVSTVRFHDRLRHCDFLKKYVHISTPEVYGSCEGYIKESNSYYPSTPYAVSRAAADMSLHAFFNSYKFPVVFTRAANVYGPGQQLYRIIPRTILYVRLGKKLSLHGGGSSDRSFVHMDDVSDATYRIAMNGIVGDTYHISTKETISIRDLVVKICQSIDMNFYDLVEESEERLGKDQSYKLDSDKIRKELGWQDTIDLEEGIASTIEWVDSNLNTLKNLPHEYIHKA